MGDASSEDPHFLELVMVFQQAAWQALGKVANPLSGRTEPSLPQARHAIDMLAMLERKTGGHLTESERRFLANALTQLRLNYVETLEQGASDRRTEAAPAPEDRAARKDSEDPGDPGAPAS